MGGRWGVVLCLLFWAWPDRVAAQELEPPNAAEDWHFLTRLDVSTLALLPGGDSGTREGFIQFGPTLMLDGGAGFGVNLGAPVRLRLWGGVRNAGAFRQEDWDSLSDWGQLIRALKLGSNEAPLSLWMGALERYSLLSGHLVRRYSNRINPDYHPAGGFLTGTLGPLYVEAFASDVLGARLFGAEAEVDLEHVLFGRPVQAGGYTLAVSAVHESGKGEGTSPKVTLAHLDGTAMVWTRPGFELHLLAGWGGQPGTGGAWGAVAGIGADVESPALNARLRLEARRQHGGFRQDAFGPDYELARFRAVGASSQPLAKASFPDGGSVYAEADVSWDAEQLVGRVHRHLTFSWAVEVFTWGRVDTDGRLALQLFDRNLELAASVLGMGLGQPGARVLVSGDLRWRFAGRLYALGQGGTLLFPEADGALRPGAYASLGVGVDNAR
ncbi:hypothetical protein D7Y15_11250 [Corallococcus sp. AB030]|uniref:hypothetical protein n=1 Tax=Corallococcus sp. AB030 TaxID=2316716 RepID=UPI000ED96321|nr:hypothetical protein [Corallococcus sp. AB030]RKI16954.1 hypothetical protein D7Y15_11250 [Corallococcus sp. AB030]